VLTLVDGRPRGFGRVACTAVLALSSLASTVGRQAQEHPATVVILDLTGDGVALSSADDGVMFDLDGVGTAKKVAWTLPGSDDSFLVLDSNGNGRIDDAREIVGSRFAAPSGGSVGTGANALAFPLQGYPVGVDGRPIGGSPKPLPKGIAVLNADDEAFAKLRLWNDVNHDGKTAPAELRSLPQANVVEILLGFQNYGWSTAPADNLGNRRLITGKFGVSARGMTFQRELAEVILAVKP